MRISDWSSDVCSSDLQREKNMSDRISLLGSTALAALMLATATPAHAQATDPANAGEGGAAADEIVVTGLRASLENAAAIKRDSGQIQDSIVAEDIGKLPEDRKSTRLNSSH